MIRNNAGAYAKQQGITVEQAANDLTAQANRQVQNGSPGAWNQSASTFLSQLHGMLPADGNSGPGYMVFASITAGWLNQISVRPGGADNFAGGYAGGAAGAYGVFGGGMMYSPGNGTATLLGVGGGVSAGKNTNLGGVSGGYSRDQGKTGIRW